VVRGAGAILKARINLSSSILRRQTASLTASTANETTSGKQQADSGESGDDDAD
jgi:hypothetical protein